MPAPAGMGSPMKWLLLTVPTWVLKRARRRAPQAMNKKAASQPILPKGLKAHRYIIRPGAIPKEIRQRIIFNAKLTCRAGGPGNFPIKIVEYTRDDNRYGGGNKLTVDGRYYRIKTTEHVHGCKQVR